MRSLIAAALITIATLLTGCASERVAGEALTLPTYATGTTVAAEPVAAPPTPDLAGASRDAYLTTLSDEIPAASTGQLLDYADLACRGLAADGDPLHVAIILRDMRPTLTDNQAAAAVGAVMGSAYCDHAWAGAR